MLFTFLLFHVVSIMVLFIVINSKKKIPENGTGNLKIKREIKSKSANVYMVF